VPEFPPPEDVIPEAFQVRSQRERPFQRLNDAERLFNRGIAAAESCVRNNWAVTASNLNLADRLIPQEKAAFLIDLPKFQLALDSRGISVEPMSELTAQQRAALSMYFATDVTMSHTTKLKVIGASSVQWRGWLRQPVFAAYATQLADDILDASVEVAKQRLAELVDAGNIKAIDRTLAWRGGFDYRNPQGGDMNAILMAIFEILDESRVPNEVMKRIADRVRALTDPQSGRIASNAAPIGEIE
jgi:hypothetical protein